MFLGTGHFGEEPCLERRRWTRQAGMSLKDDPKGQAVMGSSRAKL